jgi:hypothetical protein
MFDGIARFTGGKETVVVNRLPGAVRLLIMKNSMSSKEINLKFLFDNLHALT